MGGWALGFEMGYPRGATDAIVEKVIRAERRVREE